MPGHVSRRAGLVAAAGGALALAGCGGGSTPSAASTTTSAGPTPTATTTPTPTATATTAAPTTGTVDVIGVLATGLDVPWGLALLPDGGVLVSTRDDRTVHRLDVDAATVTRVGEVAGAVSNVDEQGEAGLLGLALSPSYATDKRIYAYWSTATDNRIGWMTYDGSRLGTPTVVVTGIPHNVHHNGGRLAFGPDGYLYASTGEAEQPQLAQDKGSLGGKILRMTLAGKPAPGNPFDSLVWTYGHRNVQGLAFDADGRLWASEFGDKTYDELNLIRQGRNYGWPDTQGRTSVNGYTSPVAEWGTDEDSPSGIAYAGGAIWMAALQGERLWRIPLAGAKASAQPQGFLRGRYGRLRSVLALADGTLLVTTSNRDGRTDPGPKDDRILRLRVT